LCDTCPCAGHDAASPPTGRCRISLEGGNRGDRHGGCSTQRLWRLACAGVAIRLRAMPRRGRTDWREWLAAHHVALAAASNGAYGSGVRAAHAAVHRTPCSASSGMAVMELGHDAGGARIEQSRKKTCSTTMA
jgi:hypothetical protein